MSKQTNPYRSLFIFTLIATDIPNYPFLSSLSLNHTHRNTFVVKFSTFFQDKLKLPFCVYGGGVWIRRGWIFWVYGDVAVVKNGHLSVLVHLNSKGKFVT